MPNKVTYLVEEEMNTVYDVILSEIKKSKYNLASGIAENGGLDITPNLVFGNLDPNAGHMGKVNMSAVNISSAEKQCKLVLKRINGLTYKIHTGGVIGFTILTLITVGVYTSTYSQEFQWEILLLPLFGLFYLLVFHVLMGITISNTKIRILKILTDNKISYKKR
jgi:hypothetical protein